MVYGGRGLDVLWAVVPGCCRFRRRRSLGGRDGRRLWLRRHSSDFSCVACVVFGDRENIGVVVPYGRPPIYTFDLNRGVTSLVLEGSVGTLTLFLALDDLLPRIA